MSLESKIRGRLGDGFEIILTTTRKNNGNVCHGCSIRKVGQSIAPVIYYDPTRNEDDIVAYIVNVYRKAGDEGNRFQEICRDLLTSKDAFLARVMPTLVNTAKNKLDGFVSVPYHDLSIIFRCVVTTGAAFKVRNELLEHLNVSVEELFRAAIANLEKNWNIVSFADLLIC